MECRPLVYVDEIIGLAFSTLMVYTTVKICIRTPLALVFSIAIQLSALIISCFLINLPRIIFFIKRIANKGTRNNKNGTAQTDTLSLMHTTSSDLKKILSYEHSTLHDHDVEAKPFNTDVSSFSKLCIVDGQRSDLDPSNLRQRSFSTLHALRQPSYLGNIDGKFGRYSYSYKIDTKSGGIYNLFNRVVGYIISHSLNNEDGQQLPRYTFTQFMYGLHIWFMTNCLKPLLCSKVWILCTLFTTISWCFVWEWGIQYITRDEGDHNLLHWVMDDVPIEYWYIESSFLIIYSITYLLNLYGSESRCWYILSINGLLDLTTTSLLTELLFILADTYNILPNNPNQPLQHFGIIFFGPLRFLRLMQAERLVSISFNWVSEVYTVVIGIATASIALLFSFSGVLFLIEAPISENSYTSPFDYIYFGVATMGTVGYGDFSPLTFYGRAVSIVFISMCITLGTLQFKRLKSALSTKPVIMGAYFDFNDKYILFWGPISNYQLLTYSKCISNTYEGIIENVVVASPLPLNYYEIVYMAISLNTRVKLSIMGGDGKITFPSYISKLVFNSSFTVVVNDMETSNFALYQANDDRETILMAMASLNITRPLGIPLAVQLHGTEYKSFLKDNDVHVFYERELKYKLLAKSINCRGLFYLLLTLFYSPSDIRRARIYVEELCNLFLIPSESNSNELLLNNDSDNETSIFNVQNQMFELIRGMKFQLFKMKFPKCSHGLPFHEFCRLLYNTRNIILIGIASGKNCVLNPVGYTIGEEITDDSVDEFYGLVMAETLGDVIKVSLLTKLPIELLPHKSDPYYSNFLSSRAHDIKLEEIAEIEHDQNSQRYRGLYIVPSYTYAVENVFTHRLPTLLICGWPKDLYDFIKIIFKNCENNIIILAPMDAVDDEDPMHLDEYVNYAVYINGSSLDMKNLIDAGLIECNCVIILNCNQISSGSNHKKLSKDLQILFVRHLIYNTINHNEMNRTPHLILDIHHASCLEYLDPSLIANVDITQKNDAINKVWENYGEFMCSYEMTSGTTFVQDMFYGLLAHSNTNLINSVDYECIDSILNGGVLKIKNRTIEGGVITLESIPISFHGKCFEVLYRYYLHVENSICIGIIRTYYMPFANYCGLKQFIIVAPQPSFILQSSDLIYIINKAIQY